MCMSMEWSLIDEFEIPRDCICVRKTKIQDDFCAADSNISF